jgi:polyisoprenoid-binding protein YceI
MLFRIAAAGLVLAAQSAATPVPLSHREVVFVAHGSLGMRIQGTTSDLTAVQAPDAMEFQVRLATLETGIAVRDRHMRDEYLEVGTYPTATLRIPRAALPANVPAGSCRGELTLHGRTHPVDVAFHLNGGSGYDVSATMQVDMRDYGIQSPKYLGVTVKPLVDVSVDFHMDAP